MSFNIENTNMSYLKLLNYMQFTKNTSKDKFLSFKNDFKIIIVILIILFGLILVNQINLPAPLKQIEKILPNENFKTIK